MDNTKITPTSDYFAPNTVNKLKDLYAITTMEHLISIADKLRNPGGFANSIGVGEKEFQAIIQKAKQKIKAPKYSGRKYPTGGL
ncbi:hypothetical protein A2331_05890 [Candidatus Falkowbacteria bacterium RIFOXYB2_FULL_34_18]|uniref:Uncharacterized protein n=1 Tax=Candidatus Falkowbacteria bacterium RIFOXYD2_FULL_34_120 TaxID=1798007 RepID=A0A1F5TP49_9BACT|nr:MAG: hypothetical protein A2331_05890 [Candidatus Falkowbacteria bacterium RIFOXYB2_FULL_34_18]OGF29080.1 MAG: hypothetical protein A2500_03505 [Candidatus Falkowbacteria bacterium RIFOXYC12_FULL_34_55]OGF36110.1 MAG: hypothetical protein A2466_03465 [Candidatus Falkowbacteria bacterium RIFOXYC2_FULL_34_220]OGF38562.1 MAG: hypothetical protein A2515_04725 [Candidatus Falkowbacteria bacterium RIFOXYD12_FULL_34_57]OGF40765.1 MAG: hypothetical protein A2531_07030 [Candidatus Falkowbacteria bact